MKENKNLKSYEKKIYHGAYCNHYFYNYAYTEDISDIHIKSLDESEWYRYTKTKRHVFYEDKSKRYTEIVNPGLIGKKGRPMGSKDSYQRTRKKGSYKTNKEDINHD